MRGNPIHIDMTPKMLGQQPILLLLGGQPPRGWHIAFP